jgi:Fic family protein
MEVSVEGLKGIHGELIKYDNGRISEYSKRCEKLYNEVYRGLSELGCGEVLKNIISESCASAIISGADVDARRVKNNLNCISDKDTMMATNCVRALQMLENRQDGFTISEGLLLKVYKVVSERVCDDIPDNWGKGYRTNQVYFGNYRTADPYKIEGYISDLIWYIKNGRCNPFIKAAVVHFYLLYIHPFCDCNGRMARILSSMVLESCGYKNLLKVPFSEVILNTGKTYSKYIVSSEKVGFDNTLLITDFVEYMLSVYEVSLKRIVGCSCSDGEEGCESVMVERSLEKGLYNLIGRYSKDGELTLEKASGIVGRESWIVRNALEGMVDGGLLLKRCSGDIDYYRVNLLD